MTEHTAEQGPLAMVLAPTRELALQIEQEAIKLCKHSGLQVVAVVGGQNIEDQAFKLRWQRGVLSRVCYQPFFRFPTPSFILAY